MLKAKRRSMRKWQYLAAINDIDFLHWLNTVMKLVYDE